MMTRTTMLLRASTLMALSNALACALVLAPVVGCGDDGDAASASDEIVRGSGTQPLRTVTEEGHEVILASQAQTDRRRRNREEALDEENLIREPNTPDPHDGEFTLDQAVDGMPLDGPLVAEIRTDLGTIFCDLFADRVPNSVANFIGLARGKRAFWDARAGDWVSRPLYNDTLFHRVVPDYLVQGGDHLGDGSGDVGYLPTWDEHETLRSHDRAGQLCMASSEENPSGRQFFITDGAAPQLDGNYPIIGQCEQTDIVNRIARLPQDSEDDNRPLTDLVISRVFIRRVPGGADQARMRPPAIPEGYDPEVPHRGASPGPGVREHELRERIRAVEAERQGGHMH